ncbi:serine/threonine-protein kinase [Streptomyces sp. NBRC 109706]|uniref:serine/threonine-protein kinase n=1 Tax=Streptomyces sp. NBRC 109706 TaxID=1550035 RepID=UPI0007850E9F|nr:serine/threonine-protein kinase [Streptomyces sp. NBRC 109706]
MRGTLLDGRYRITDRIGAGGMGTVWEAWDERLGRSVAVKTLTGLPDEVGEELRARFEREARLAAGLASRQVVTIHDFGRTRVDDRQVLYLVMERLHGRPMSVGAPSPGLDDIVRWGGDVCRALEAAHRAGVVHRDLKPSNVLVDAEGRAVVLDFGVARFLGDATELTRLTRTGAAVGTPAYMSPEQCLGAERIDARSDLYSLGCLLYELLTGRPPFVNGLVHVVLRMHIDDAPVPPSVLRPGLPAAWDALVLGLLAKRPQDRPADAATVRARLSALPTATATASARTVTTHIPPPPTLRPGLPTVPPPPPERATPGRGLVITAAVVGFLLPSMWWGYMGSGWGNGPRQEALLALLVGGALALAAYRARPELAGGRIALATFLALALGFAAGGLVHSFDDGSRMGHFLAWLLVAAVVSLALQHFLAPRARHPLPPGRLGTALRLNQGRPADC